MADCEITCRNNGPILVQGKIVLKDQDGNEFDLAGRKAVSLCRCGDSENKPFCDGAHAKTGFKSTITAT